MDNQSNSVKEILPHQQRVIDEKGELDEKVEKLQTFIKSSPIYDGLILIDKKLLQDQLAIMLQYSEILLKRINRF